MVLLMAIPGILLTFVLAPWLLKLLYTGEFIEATQLLRWLILGMALKIVSWPMGFIQLAKARKDFFVATEILYAVIYTVTLYAVVGRYGLIGAGVATVFGYLLLIAIYRYLGKKMSGFAWSTPALTTLLLMLAACALVVLSSLYLDGVTQWGASLSVVSIVSLVSLWRLVRLLRPEVRGGR
jgi:PST family polysaccharide transporter